MKARLLLACLSAVAVGLTAPASAAGASAEAERDWTRTVVKTAEGGYRMGNPAAVVKLVEYGSLACPTCARFAADSEAPLMAKVKSGKLSFEFRNIVLNSADLAAVMLSRCGGADDYFALNDRIFTAQRQWTARLGALSAEEKGRIAALQPQQRLAPIAEAAGLVALAAQAGIPQAKARQCLGDPALLQEIIAIQQAAAKNPAIHGTPTFFVNGVHAEGVHGWTALAPLLTPPGG